MVVYSVQQIFTSAFCVTFAIFISFYLLSVVVVIPIDAYKSSIKDLTQKTEGTKIPKTSTENAASLHVTEKPEEMEIDDLLDVDDYLIFQVPKFCPPGQVMDGNGRCRKKLFGEGRKLSFN